MLLSLYSHSQPPDQPAQVHSYPGPRFRWTMAELTTLCENLQRFHLVFTVTLPREGVAWQSFDNQVVSHCRNHSILIPNYASPTGPNNVCSVFLATSSRPLQVNKIFNTFDDLTVNTWTVESLLKRPFSNMQIPIAGDWGSLPFLMIGKTFRSLTSCILP